MSGMKKETIRRYRAIARLVSRGHSVKEVSAKKNVSPAVVCKACDTFNVFTKRKSGSNEFSDRSFQIIAAVVNAQKTYEQIATENSVTSAYVRRIAKRLREAGCRLEKRKPGPANP